MDLLFQSHDYKAVSGTATDREVRKKKEKKNPKQNRGTGDMGEEEIVNENGSKATGLGAKHTDRSKFSLPPAM